jgi:tyrosinase
MHLDQYKIIAGTITLFNNPPSRDANLGDVVQMSWLNLDPRTIGDLLGTLDDTTFCYISL